MKLKSKVTQKFSVSKKKCRNSYGHSPILAFLLPLGFLVFSANDDEMVCVNEGHQFSCKSPSVARAVEKVMSKETDETRVKC